MLQASFIKYQLNFSFGAGTSRGVLHQKDSFFIKISDKDNPLHFGLGEAAPLSGLSLDAKPNYEAFLNQQLKIYFQNLSALDNDFWQAIPPEESALRFALETAWLDFQHGGKRLIFDTNFAKGQEKIPINGLIWMGDKAFMIKQIAQKLEQGFTCLKMKVGAIDFAEECSILKHIRQQFNKQNLTLRVDANGAWATAEALERLQALEQFDLHSIEQPIAPQQWEHMSLLCEKSPVPIALDEELMYAPTTPQKKILLEQVKPNFIVLKPTLHGGVAGSQAWIELAQELQVPWWITSALESNVGLNAICQLASHLGASGFQGLGTGQLYTNNLASPLQVNSGFIQSLPQESWNLESLTF
ncbi:MAG: o-succinylbenzoate synthase [Cytophagales bacterium]|nr:MAG: o-succinylbenzoate synthase [Cytophagales bacterium]TAF61266.1 MAG: o-succinylbenzoate synthase [Cytophagales bacterium]